MSAVATLWFVDDPEPSAVLRDAAPDAAVSRALLERIHRGRSVTPVRRVPLSRAATGAGFDRATVFVGSFPGVTVVCSRDLVHRHPSTLPDVWVQALACDRTYLVVSDPEGAWGAFGVWERGRLRRAFGASAITFFEDEGLPFEWERPFWAGDHPIRWPTGVLPHPGSLPFHPRRLVESANEHWLGFRHVGGVRAGMISPDEVQVWAFAVDSNENDCITTSSTEPVRSTWWRRSSRHQ